MTDDPAALWEEALARLGRRVSAADYETWLEGSAGLRLERGALAVGVRSEFAAEWLRTRLEPLVRRTLAEIADPPPAVRYEALPAGADGGAPGPPPAAAAPLLPRFGFGTFAAGPGNRAALAGARDVAAGRLGAFFVRGGEGLGKTHLLQAAASLMLAGGLRPVYVSAAALAGGGGRGLRDLCREADALLIDDAGDAGDAEDELLRAAADLRSRGRPVAAAAGGRPGPGERLRALLADGVSASLRPPGVETRLAILRLRAAERGIRADDGALAAIARRRFASVRALEDALARAEVLAAAAGGEIGADAAAAALADGGGADPEPATPAAVIGAVCGYYGVELEDLLSRSRERRVARPRQMAMYLMREVAKRNFAEIGAALGGRDHSTAHYGWSRTADALREDGDALRDARTIGELIRLAGERAA